ncbi:hypothetical protein [Actinophytocola sediminis]
MLENRRGECGWHPLDEDAFVDLRGNQDEDAVAPVLDMAVPPGDADLGQRVTKCVIEALADCQPMGVGSVKRAETLDIDDENGAMYGRPRPAWLTSLPGH